VILGTTGAADASSSSLKSMAKLSELAICRAESREIELIERNLCEIRREVATPSAGLPRLVLACYLANHRSLLSFFLEHCPRRLFRNVTTDA
jgi:hypothetical protein